MALPEAIWKLQGCQDIIAVLAEQFRGQLFVKVLAEKGIGVATECLFSQLLQSAVDQGESTRQNLLGDGVLLLFINQSR